MMSTKVRTSASRAAGLQRRTAGPRPAAASAAPGHLQSADGVLALQRTAGNQAVAGALALQREGGAGEDLQATRFVGSAKLEACLDNRARLVVGDSDSDAVVRVQGALQDCASKTGNTYDLGKAGVDGKYGTKTSEAVKKFKADEGLGSTQFGDVGPGTMRRLDEIFRSDPKPPDKKDENKILGGLFHNPDLENLFDKIMLQYGKMTAQQGRALTVVQQDLATTEKAEPSIAGTILQAAAEQVIDRTLGGGDTLRKVVADGLKGITDADLVQSGFDKVVGTTFDAAVSGGKDVVKANLAQGGLETQPLARFIDAQHNALIDSANQAQEAFVKRKQGAGGADQGLRTFTESDKAQILASFPAVADPRVDRAGKLLTGLEQATAKAQEKEYTQAIRQWSIGNAQHATDDGFNPGGVPSTDGNALRGKGRNEVPGVLEISFTFVGNQPKGRPAITGLSMSGLSALARNRINLLQAATSLKDLAYVERATGSGGGRVGVTKTETGQIFNTGSNDDGNAYLTAKGDGRFDLGEQRLFEELEATTVAQAGGIQGPSRSIF
jgi:peptidoglycan hydrolase-like protein with peptidoglycan-binding domain